MSVPIEACSVIVRNSTLAEKYPGGIEEYRQRCPNATYCSDGLITRIGFMVSGDAQQFVATLAAAGLIPDCDQQSVEVAVYHQHQGFVFPCNWLEVGDYSGIPITWLVGYPPGDLHPPEKWGEQGSLVYHTPEEIRERLEFVRREGAIEVFRDKQTGKELYIGRTSPSQEDQTKHDELYSQACNLVQGHLILDNRPLSKITPAIRHQLLEGIKLFERAIAINHQNWAAMWLIGKVYQRLEYYVDALSWFSRAHHVNPTHIDVAREAAIAAMESGQPEKGVYFCERALVVEPENAGLMANHALAVLFTGKPLEAQQIAEKSLKQDPSDKITAHLFKIIKEVNKGKRTCPRHMRDLR